MWKKVGVPGKTHVSQLAMTIPSYILLMSIKGIGLGLQQWWASALPLSFLDNCFTATLTNTTNNPIPPKCCIIIFKVLVVKHYIKMWTVFIVIGLKKNSIDKMSYFGKVILIFFFIKLRIRLLLRMPLLKLCWMETKVKISFIIITQLMFPLSKRKWIWLHNHTWQIK